MLSVGGIVVVTVLTVSLACGAPPTFNDPLVLTVELDKLEQHVTRAALLPALPDPKDFGLRRIDVFEESYNFIYISGALRRGDEATADAVDNPKTASMRRVFILKPSILVIVDQLPIQDVEAVVWKMQAPFLLSSLEGTVVGKEDNARFRSKCVLPEAVDWTIGRENERGVVASHLVALPEESGCGTLRLVHIMSFRSAWDAALPECSLETKDSSLQLKMVAWDELTDRNRVVQMTLANGSANSKLKIVDQGEFADVDERLLPAGILPPGKRGVQLQKQWDIPYRNMDLATWDTGRPSSELMRLVESETIQPCRVVEFGCGTGDDAIYLASKGFDVTAIDIAPTALAIAEKKAIEANVEVLWLLADVLNPPKLEAFDLLYDRGCYHDVRRHFAKQYVAAVRRVTHAGSRALILAGNANKDSYWRFHGPPRVKEEEIRADFANGFRIESLKEFRFDPSPPEKSGALAWSVLLKRE